MIGLFRKPALPETIIVAGRPLPLLATRVRSARGVRLRADAVQGALRLTLPARGGVPEALALIDSHRGWLEKQVSGWPRPLPFAPGAVIPFDDGRLQLDWAAAHRRQPERDGDVLRIGGPAESLPGRVLRWLKAEALADMAAATEQLAAAVERPVTQVRVADPRARWGSCATQRGQIAYSWRLIMAPSLVRRNVVAHEVAHLVHADHGAGFHALHARLDGNGEASRRWLRRNGAALHWVGRSG